MLVVGLGLVGVGCGGGESDSEVAGSTTEPAVASSSSTSSSVVTTTTAEASTTTAAPTTTISAEPIDPALLTVEERAALEAEIETAYLRSWEVYYDAHRNLDLSILDESFAGAALAGVVAKIEDKIAEGTRTAGSIEHNYQIILEPDGTALVVDAMVNHLVKIDAVTHEPLEEDPNEQITQGIEMERIGGTWKVVFKATYRFE